MQKRIIDIDYQNTLDGIKGNVLADFMAAALEHGHEVRIVSFGMVPSREKLIEIYGAFMSSVDVVSKSALVENYAQTGAMMHDILVDDNPMVHEGEAGFKDFCNRWVHPESGGLIEELQDIAHTDLGFKWKPQVLEC